MANKKIHTLKVDRKSGTRYVQGTVEDLCKYFSYTLECGNSWNKKINRNPKTIASLEKNINASVDETQRGYNRDYYYIVDAKDIPEGAKISEA